MIVETSSELSELIAALPAELVVGVSAASNADDLSSIRVLDVTHDSRQVAPGTLFVCVVGDRDDGHRFAAAAVEAGAVALMVEHLVDVDVAQLIVTDSRRAMGPIAAAVHGFPATRLRTVGVTGTNGKTTTTHLLAAILRSAGVETRIQGTLSGARTTPEAPDLQRLLAGFVADGVQAVVMEVSSHALALHRVSGMTFDVAVFTNLGRDHLDLHESVEAYFRAKALLFEPALSRTGVTNLDDLHGRLLFDAALIPMVGYSTAELDDVIVGAEQLRFTWRGLSVTVPIGGRFNVGNALAALTTAVALGIDETTAVAGIATAPAIPGRFELVSDRGRDPFAVIVDYAHTPDGLVEVLGSARAVAAGGRVIVVFGCGGDRDAEKRPLMGAAAAAEADLVVITSDNPRHEDPEAIIAAALGGVDPTDRQRVVTEVDRRRAIGIAFASAQPGDVVVIAGKGHEVTQTIGDVAQPFDDRIVARELLAASADQTAPGATP